jgi:catecholate siderophore receptor
VASVTGRFRHTFNEQITLRNQTQYNHYTIDAQETGPSRVGIYDGHTFTGVPTSATGNFTDIPPDQLYVLLGSHDRDITDSSIYNQTDLVGKFHTGSVQHLAIAGIELGYDSYDNQGYSRVDPNIAGPNPGLAVVSLLNPSYGPAPADTVRTATNHASSTAGTVGIYVNDTMSLSQQWKVIAGVREDWFNASINNSISLPSYAAQNVTFTSVRAGVLYQPTDAQTYYAAYGTSFDPSLETLTVTSGQQNIPPESNKSYEVGGKWDVLGGDLQLASALFQVTKSNARSQIETGVYDVTGEVRVRGVEVSATGHLTPRWQVIAGYTYLNAEIVKASALDGTQGKVPANTPQNSASIWTTYSLSQEWEVGGGITSQSSVYASNTNVVTVPGYARLDATVAFHQPRYDIRLNLINALDKQYFASVIPSDAGRSVPAAGRTGIVTLTYRF